jgi:hypothetical protein
MSVATDHRKSERVHHVRPQKVIRFSAYDFSPRSHVIVSADLSATGIRFTTKEPFQKDELCLLSLSDEKLKQLQAGFENKDQGWIHSGDCYLSQVVWTSDKNEGGACNVGARFLNLKDSSPDILEAFQKFMNHQMMTDLSLYEIKLPINIY